jgi:hypothetical protein
MEAARGGNAQREYKHERNNHHNGLHEVGRRFGKEAAEERVQQHEQRADDHHELVVLAKQLGEQLAAGDKAAAGIYGEKYQNEHRRDGHDDLFLFVEAVGQKVRHRDGIACCKRVAAQRLCDDEPVEVLLRSKMPMRFTSGWTSLLSSTAVKAKCRW